jgi:hypothetical protein
MRDHQNRKTAFLVGFSVLATVVAVLLFVNVTEGEKRRAQLDRFRNLHLLVG